MTLLETFLRSAGKYQENAVLDRDGIATGEVCALVPVGIDGLRGAGGVESRDLVLSEKPADRAEILAELLFVARAHDDADDRGAL